MTSGTARTFSVVGVYWISSNTSVRKTTAPGVFARSSPTVNASGSTIVGTRGGDARSDTNCFSPRTALRPPVSMAAFSDSGLTTGTLLGARASTRFVAVNRIRSSSFHSRSASSISSQAVRAVARCSCIARRSRPLPDHAGSANRLSFLLGASSDLPAAIRATSLASSPARFATAPGRRASAEPNRSAVPAGGTMRRSGPTAASTSSMSRPMTASVGSSAVPSARPAGDPSLPCSDRSGRRRPPVRGRLPSGGSLGRTRAGGVGRELGHAELLGALLAGAQGKRRRARPPGTV